MPLEIKALLFDVDGSVCPQGGAIHPVVGGVFRRLREIELPMGPATGKNADYARGMATGIGIPPWNFISAEGGAQFLILRASGPPPIFEQMPNIYTGGDLDRFCEIIRLRPFERVFHFRNQPRELYRPELKEGILSLFPAGTDIERTLEWVSYLEEIVRTHRLVLKVIRHSDGCVDIVPTAISKALGVQRVCELYSCEAMQILTVVDGANDAELAIQTTVIAVSNAHESIKEIARRQGGYVAEREEGPGFVEGLHYYARQRRFGNRSEAIQRIAEEALTKL